MLSTPLDRGLLDSSRELFRFSWCRDLVNGRASKVADVIREPRLCSEAFGVGTGSDRLHPVSEVRPLMLYTSFKTMVDVVVQNACPPHMDQTIRGWLDQNERPDERAHPRFRTHLDPGFETIHALKQQLMTSKNAQE